MATSIFDYASFVWDGRLAGAAPGKLFPLKPNVKDLTGDFLTVSRTTAKWVLGSNGVLTEVAANTPAIEYNADGSYKGLLVEPAATNLALRSAEFDNAYWTKNNSTISANATTSPNGLTTADKLVANNLSTTSSIERTITVTTATTYTMSVFYKISEAPWIRFVASPVTGTSPARAWFNASTGALGTNNGGFSRIATTNYGNGWYRAEATFVSSGTSVAVFFAHSDADNSNDFAGNGTNGTFFWGAQLETGSVATSYIPTVASTANRTADSVTLTGASSLIGQTQGTLYAEAEVRVVNSASARGIVEIGIDNTNRYRMVMSSSSDALAGIGTTGGVDQFLVFTAGGQTGIKKVALAYAPNDVAMYQQGLLVGTDTSNSAPASTSIAIGCGISGSGTIQLNGWIRSVAIFPPRLSNTILESITS